MVPKLFVTFCFFLKKKKNKKAPLWNKPELHTANFRLYLNWT